MLEEDNTTRLEYPRCKICETLAQLGIRRGTHAPIFIWLGTCSFTQMFNALLS
jgi:hypothetical protein